MIDKQSRVDTYIVTKKVQNSYNVTLTTNSTEYKRVAMRYWRSYEKRL